MTAPARVKWRSAIVESDLSTVVKMVAVALAEFVNTDTGMAWPGLKTLAERASCNEKTVRRSLGVLKDAGWIELVKRGGTRGEKKEASVWRISMPTVGTGPTITVGTGPTIEASTVGTESTQPWTLSPSTVGTESTQPVIEPGTDEPGESVGVIPRDTYEVDPFDPARPTVFQLARNQVKIQPEEMDQYIEEAISLHGVSRVTEVVAALADATSPNTYARQFDKKLTRALNAYQLQQVINAADPFVPANNPTPIDRTSDHADCPPPCDGHGNYVHEQTDGTTTVEPNACPIGATLGARHLKAVGA